MTTKLVAPDKLEFEGNKIDYRLVDGKISLWLSDVIKALSGISPSYHSYASKEEVIKFLDGNLDWLNGELIEFSNHKGRYNFRTDELIFVEMDAFDEQAIAKMKKWVKKLKP